MALRHRACTRRRTGGSTPATLLAAALGAALGAVALLAVAPAASAPKCTAAEGQALIDAGRYDHAVREFSCVIASDPTGVEGYRGRIEARLMLGLYAEAYADYARITAVVEPVHPDVDRIILDGYRARLDAAPADVHALTGLSFARWNDFDYAQAIHVLNRLLELRPDDVFGNLFRGSSRVLGGKTKAQGIADLDRAIALAPTSPDVRYVVADAYTYGLTDYERAHAEASLALQWGLDTPRVHAILGAALNAFGEVEEAAGHIARHIDQVTTELVPAGPLTPGSSFALPLVPGRTVELAVPAVAGQRVSIAVSSRDYWDTIAVLLAPDGTPLVGSDDESAYHAAFDWVAPATATYRLRVTFFESVITGNLVVTRD